MIPETVSHQWKESQRFKISTDLQTRGSKSREIKTLAVAL